MLRAAMIVAFTAMVVTAMAQEPSPEMALRAQRHYKAGVELMRAENWEQAVAEFRNAIEIDPLMTLAHYNIGQCRMAQKRFVEAVQAYQDCRAAFEKIGALSAKDRERRDRARRDEINDLKNDLTRVHTLKVGTAEHYRLRIEDRIRNLEAMESRDLPENSRVPAEVMLALGSAYFRQDKLADAEREYREALRVNRKFGAAHNNLAVILLLTGRLDEAETEMKLAERNGHKVSPRFKEDLKRARQER
jgi:tetratricopeptide (TPR) repeat protein